MTERDMARRLLQAAWALALLAHGACSSDCPGRADCLSQGPPRLHYAVELVPPQDSMLVREQRDQLVTDSKGATDLALSAPVALSGRVFIGDPTQPSIVAHIFVTRLGPPIIPGRSLVYDADAVAGVFAGGSSFTLVLVPGTYLLHITPKDAAQPPIALPLTIISDKTADIALPAPSELQTISGRVVGQGGQGVPQMTVSVSDSSGVVSTTIETNMDGAFTVRVPRLQGSFILKAEPASNAAAVPTLRRSISLAPSTPLPALLLQMPAFQPAQVFHYSVVARQEGGMLAGVAGNQTTFRCALQDPYGENGIANYETTVRTDSAGIAEARLLPDQVYTIKIQTSPTSAFSGKVIESVRIEAPETHDTEPIELERKSVIVGTLLGSAGQPVVDAAIEAFGVMRGEAMSFARAASSAATTVSDGQGKFRLPVEPGQYDLEVTPPERSAFPRWALQNVIVDKTATDLPLDIRLPEAHRVAGIVRDPYGKPLADVDVRIYLVGDTTDARLRGQARTDRNGKFMLVLPSP